MRIEIMFGVPYHTWTIIRNVGVTVVITPKSKTETYHLIETKEV